MSVKKWYMICSSLTKKTKIIFLSNWETMLAALTGATNREGVAAEKQGQKVD